MAEKAKVSTKASRALMEAIGLFAVEPLTAKIAAVGGSLHGWLSNKGQTIGERDSMIAGTALAHGHIMVTDNVRKFERVPGLQIQNWRTGAA
jgi:tRNA(fMet)-specific endonuclease VapC